MQKCRKYNICSWCKIYNSLVTQAFDKYNYLDVFTEDSGLCEPIWPFPHNPAGFRVRIIVFTLVPADSTEFFKL